MMKRAASDQSKHSKVIKSHLKYVAWGLLTLKWHINQARSAGTYDVMTAGCTEVINMGSER